MTSDKRMSDALDRIRHECSHPPVPDDYHLVGRVTAGDLRCALAGIDALRADLAAARRVPDDAELQETLTRVRFSCGIDTSDRVQRAFSRLSAAKAEAERERDEARAALTKAREALEEIKPHMREDAVWSRIGKALFTLAIVEAPNDK